MTKLRNKEAKYLTKATHLATCEAQVWCLVHRILEATGLTSILDYLFGTFHSMPRLASPLMCNLFSN